jgi:prepilin-type N-terminal cleavage/methylation domain-containing protein
MRRVLRSGTLRAAGARPEGFTLLEILVAMAVLGVLLSALFGAFNALLTSAEHVEGSMTRFEGSNDCLRRILGDLGALQVSLPPAYRKPQASSDPDPWRFVGESDGGGLSALRFASLAHFSLERESAPGLAEIVYHATQGGDGLVTITRGDRLLAAAALDGPGRSASSPEAVICEGVETVALSFFDADGQERERWDSESASFGYATPSAVRIRIVPAERSAGRTVETVVTLPARREKID